MLIAGTAALHIVWETHEGEIGGLEAKGERVRSPRQPLQGRYHPVGVHRPSRALPRTRRAHGKAGPSTHGRADNGGLRAAEGSLGFEVIYREFQGLHDAVA